MKRLFLLTGWFFVASLSVIVLAGAIVFGPGWTIPVAGFLTFMSISNIARNLP